ncbi:MAG: SCO family protein [Fimbriimonadales bacterium]
MRAFVPSLLLMMSMGTLLAQGIRPNEERALGTTVPNVRLVDAEGNRFELHDLKGNYVILSPVYVGCPQACIAITQSLKKAVEQVGGLGEEYIVLSVSFNPKEGLSDIQRFHKSHQLNLPGWRLAYVPEESQLFALLDQIDFRFTYINEQILDHPNVILFLDKDLVIRHYEYGTDYTPEQIQRGLRIASGKLTLVERLLRTSVPLLLILLTSIGAVGWYLWTTRPEPSVQQTSTSTRYNHLPE